MCVFVTARERQCCDENLKKSSWHSYILTSAIQRAAAHKSSCPLCAGDAICQIWSFFCSLSTLSAKACLTGNSGNQRFFMHTCVELSGFKSCPAGLMLGCSSSNVLIETKMILEEEKKRYFCLWFRQLKSKTPTGIVWGISVAWWPLQYPL